MLILADDLSTEAITESASEALTITRAIPCAGNEWVTAWLEQLMSANAKEKQSKWRIVLGEYYSIPQTWRRPDAFVMDGASFDKMESQVIHSSAVVGRVHSQASFSP